MFLLGFSSHHPSPHAFTFTTALTTITVKPIHLHPHSLADDDWHMPIESFQINNFVSIVCLNLPSFGEGIESSAYNYNVL